MPSSSPDGLSRRIRRWSLVFIFFGVIGFIDATWLTMKAFQGGTIPCLITSGCEQVTTSSYSKIAGIPIALLGALNYLVVIIMALVAIDRRDTVWLRWLSWWTTLGFLFSLYLVYLQAFVLHAYCLYCLISAGAATGLWLTGIITRRLFKNADALLPPVSSS